MNVINSVWAFILAISVLVAFHEFGHYWTAKKLGVKVLRFSVGFGPVIWKKIAGPDKTEYVISALPLGGYVKMLGEQDGEVEPHELGRAFKTQPVWKRFAIVVAGPLFNFILAVILYAFMYMLGVSGIKPVLGDIAPNSAAAQAGLHNGDEIISVNNKRVTSWQETAIALLNDGIDGGIIDLRVKALSGKESIRSLTVERGSLLGDSDLMDTLGISRWSPTLEPVLGEILADGAARNAGLQAGDKILTANNKSINNWGAWVKVIQAHPGKPLDITFKRNGQVSAMTLTPKAIDEKGRLIGKIGAGPEVSEAYRTQLEQLRVEIRYNPLASLAKAAQRTWSDSKLTLLVIWKLITGEASLKNISGPVTIAQYAGITASIGIATFLGFLAIVSVSLGVLNLLPIPILDGGHLLLYIVEWIKGSPVPEVVEAIGQRIGIVLLGALMIFALSNDISRLFNG